MSSWCNGRLLPADAVRIDPDDRGFALGDGVFETVRVLEGVPVRLDEHLARLRHGAGVLGIPVQYPDAAIRAAFAAVLSANAVRAGAGRITLSRGPAPRGIATPATVAPTLLVAAHAGQSVTTPVRLMIARSTCRNEHSPLSRIKSLNYLDGIIARREAEACGLDDAILLNTAGLVAEGTVATLLVSAGGQLWTPRVVDGALPGIARQSLLAAGLVAERAMHPAWLCQADALFLCNSLGVRAVASLDGRVLTAAPAVLQQLSGHLDRPTEPPPCAPPAAC